jgi:PKD repeat protein
MIVATLAACGGGGGGAKGPVARLTVTPTSGAAPLSITASGEASSDAKGTIVKYAWDFGDGSSATGSQVTHTYATVGEFLVKLTVTNDKGKTGSASASVVATGPVAVYNGAVFDSAKYEDEPSSGTLDSTPLQ